MRSNIDRRGGLEPLQMVLESDTGQYTRERMKGQGDGLGVAKVRSQAMYQRGRCAKGVD